MRTLTHRPDEAGLRRADAVAGMVSVVIPAFNAERWIGETLASVRGQSYEPIDVIVVDDGSTDTTTALAERQGARVVRTTGAGPGGARNAGMAVARGQYIQFLDADDLLATGKVARQVATLEESGADVAWEPFHHLVARAGSAAEFVVGARVVPDLGADFAASLLTTRGFIQIGAILVRRTPRTDAVWFADGRDSVEDVRYTMSLAMCGARFVSSNTGERGLLYRQHTGARYSMRPTLEFANACAANAAWAQAAWEREGTLTPPRRAALGEAYAFAARQLAALDAEAFAAVAARGVKLGADFTRRLPPQVRWLTRLVGYARAESIATGWRRVRATVRSADGHAGERR